MYGMKFETVKCKLCGKVWQPRVENPQTCVKCKRYDWNDSKQEIKGRKKLIRGGDHAG